MQASDIDELQRVVSSIISLKYLFHIKITTTNQRYAANGNFTAFGVRKQEEGPENDD